MENQTQNLHIGDLVSLVQKDYIDPELYLTEGVIVGYNKHGFLVRFKNAVERRYTEIELEKTKNIQ